MVELEIKKKYEKFRLDVAFKSEKKRIGILGASGCGKSLTLKSIAGIERPEKGRIVIVSEHDRGAEYRDWIYRKQRR